MATEWGTDPIELTAPMPQSSPDDVVQPQPLGEVDQATDQPVDSGWGDAPIALPSKFTKQSARNTEISQDNTPRWKYWMSENAPAIAEIYGAVGGSILGALAGTATGTPAGAEMGAVVGSGYGAGSARIAANEALRRLGIPRTLDIKGTENGEYVYENPKTQTQEFVDAANRSMTSEMVGMGLGRGIQLTGSKVASGTRWTKDQFQSAKTKAGEVLSESQKLGPLEDYVKKEKLQVRGSADRLGVGELPQSTSQNIREQALVLARSKNPEVKASELSRLRMAEEQAEMGLNKVLPEPTRANIENVRIQLERTKAGVLAERELAKKELELAKVNGSAAQQAAMEAKISDLERVLGGKDKLNTQALGEGVQQRFSYGQEGAGPRFVKDEFEKLYAPFNKNPNAVAETAEFSQALEAASPKAREAGLVLSNYVTQGEKTLQRMTTVDEQGLAAFPETFPIGTWRNIKGELAQAAQDASRAGDMQAARELKMLTDIARRGEDVSASKLGEKLASKYTKIRKAYATNYIDPFRRGFVGADLLRQGGKEIGGEALQSGKVMDMLLDVNNADGLMLALGSEKASVLGKTLDGLTTKELQAMGRAEAREIVGPYLEHTIAAKYVDAGRGAKGAEAVEKYLRLTKTQAILDKYGFDAAKFAKAAKDVNSATASSASALGLVSRESADTVAKGLGITDPYLVGKHVLKSANPRITLQQLFRAGQGAEWESSIKGLVKEELRAQIKAGNNIFKNKKTMEVMSGLYSVRERQALRDYHRVLDHLQRRGTQLDIGLGGMGEPVNTMQKTSVGVGQMYLYSKIFRGLLGVKVRGREAAILRFLDDALIDPQKAKMLLDHFNGTPFAKRKLLEEVTQIAKKIDRYDRAYSAATQLSAYPLRTPSEDSTPENLIPKDQLPLNLQSVTSQ